MTALAPSSGPADVVAAVLVFCGALLTLASAIGLLRFRTTLSRMHPAAKPQVLGLLLVIAGALVRVWPASGTGMLLLTGLVALCTAPVIANRVGNIAYRESMSGDPYADQDGGRRD